MKKYFVFLLAFAPFALSLQAKELSKEEKKRIKSELKEYMKNPEAYQKRIAQYQADIDTSQARYLRLKGLYNDQTNTINDLHNKLTTFEDQLKQCKNKPVPVCPECPVPGAVPTNGVVYKVQIGLFKKLDLGNYFTEPKYVGIDKTDDVNRYVISYFTEEHDAKAFVTDLKKFGIKGAFVTKYENGQRVVEDKKTKNKAKQSTDKKKVPLRNH